MRLMKGSVMFKKRAITVRLNKIEDEEVEVTPCRCKSFEKNADTIRKNLEGLGAKMFLGVCVYMILDTYRQVAVAKAVYHPE